MGDSAGPGAGEPIAPESGAVDAPALDFDKSKQKIRRNTAGEIEISDLADEPAAAPAPEPVRTDPYGLRPGTAPPVGGGHGYVPKKQTMLPSGPVGGSHGYVPKQSIAAPSAPVGGSHGYAPHHDDAAHASAPVGGSHRYGTR